MMLTGKQNPPLIVRVRPDLSVIVDDSLAIGEWGVKYILLSEHEKKVKELESRGCPECCPDDYD